MVTKYRLAEEIHRLIDAGNRQAASKIHINELMLSVAQVANSLLKAEYFQANVPFQEMIPNGAMIATYDNLLVSKWGTTSKITLPAKPIRLPRNIGVFSVYQMISPFDHFIPVEMGQFTMIRGLRMISDCLDNVGYEVYGNDIVFTRDITNDPTPVYCSVRLVILDISQYGDYDPLPLPADMEWEIKKQVLALYISEGASDKLVDSSVSESKNIPSQQQAQS